MKKRGRSLRCLLIALFVLADLLPIQARTLPQERTAGIADGPKAGDTVVIDAIRMDTCWRNTPLSLTVDAHSETSRPLYYALWAEEIRWQSEPQLTIETNGTYVVLVNDVPQEAGSARQSVTVSCIDTRPPKVTWEPLVDGWVSSQTLRVQAEDAQSGLADEPYSFDEGRSWQCSPTRTVSENGRYTVWVRDRCGNVQTAVIDVSNIDAQAPQLPEGAEIHLRPTNAAPSSTIVHHLLFGSYFSSMTVCVPYVDEGSGVAQIELFDAQGQLLAQAQGQGRQGEAQLVVSADENVRLLATPLTVRLIDHCGNVRSIAVTEENANVCSLRELLLETVRPTIQIGHEGGTLDEQGRLYDTPTLSFVVELADADAGLQAASVTVNEERLLQERWVEEQQKQATLTVELPATAKQEGENRLNVATVDHAGNRCEQTLIFYQDTTAPKILSATIDGADALKKESGYSLFPMAGAQLCVQTQDLFADAIEVELTMIAADGEKTVQRIAGDAQGMAVYSLPDGFKGVIELCAIDAVGNRSEVVTSAQMIVESDTAHAASAKTMLTLPKSEVQDAQGHPLYAHPITATLSLEDRHNGIRAVSWTLWTADGERIGQGAASMTSLLAATDAMSDEEGVHWTVKESEQNLVLSLCGTIPLRAEGNAQRMELVWTDHGGHQSCERICFGIDRTSPQLRCTFADGSSVQGLFNDPQALTLRVSDVNIDLEQLRTELIVDGRVQLLQPVWKADGMGWQTSLLCAEDGGIQVRLSACDRAGNRQELITERFFIDRQAPRWQLTSERSLSDGPVNGSPVGWLTVQESHFVPDGIRLLPSPGTQLPMMGEWQRTAQGYRAALYFLQEGTYDFRILAQDAAGNRAIAEGASFVLDQSAPLLRVLGIPEGAALRSLPIVEIRSSDAYTPDVSIRLSLQRTDGQSVKLPPLQKVAQEVFRLSLADGSEWADGSYRLTVTASDRAGNTQREEISFLVNQSGSTFLLPSALNHAYVAQLSSLRIRQYNLSPLIQDTLILIHNNESRILQKGRDYTVSEDGTNGHTYTYTLKDALFAQEGVYRLRILSRDAAGNTSDSFAPDNDASLTFVIDRSAPNIEWLQENGEDAGLTCTFAISDHYALASVRFRYDGKELEATKQDERYTLTLPYENGKLEITAIDAAGNQASRCLWHTAQSDAPSRASIPETPQPVPAFLLPLILIGMLAVGAMILGMYRKVKKS